MTTHFHIFTWVVALILFFAGAFMATNTKGQKITHMTLRLFYVLVIISGALLFFEYSSTDAAQYGIKFLLGLLTIGMMEMVLVRKKKNKPTKTFWILFYVFFILTFLMGVHLPYGWHWF